jgi:serum/glucocorticoid-regulated kinase 2
MDPQRHQVRPACGETPPVVTEDCPWTVGVAENPHDPTSYILCIQSTYLVTMKKSLHFFQNLFGFLWRDELTASLSLHLLPAHTRHLTLIRTAREVIELHRQLLDAYPAIPHPAFPIQSSTLAEPTKQIPTMQRTRPCLISPPNRSEQTHSNDPRAVTINHEPHVKVTIEEPVSVNSTSMALAWYLAALSNDPVFCQVPQWKNFVRVRAEDLERASVK